MSTLTPTAPVIYAHDDRSEQPCVSCATKTTDRDAVTSEAVCPHCWRTGLYRNSLQQRGIPLNETAAYYRTLRDTNPNA
jgi:hypothetical protein